MLISITSVGPGRRRRSRRQIPAQAHHPDAEPFLHLLQFVIVDELQGSIGGSGAVAAVRSHQEQFCKYDDARCIFIAQPEGET